AGPKMAALLAAAAEPAPPVSSVKLESGGVILICGRDEIAVEAGNLLKDHLDAAYRAAAAEETAPRVRAASISPAVRR
ncbi:MAG: 4Fe-4S ferredoxin, partial [Xanthobacteraceae bacterium]